MSMNFSFYYHSVSQSGCKYTTPFLSSHHTNQKKFEVFYDTNSDPYFTDTYASKKIIRNKESIGRKAKNERTKGNE